MEDAGQKKTYFAPPGRLSFDALTEQMNQMLADPVVKVILEMVNGYAMILNEQRQVLAANQEVLEALHASSCDHLVGLRPGEVFDCIHVSEGPDGCGTAPHCQECGAVIAILACQRNKEVSEGECRMSMERDGQYLAADFSVKATPVKLGGVDLTVVVLQDISATKRREVLEKVFLHDFLNMVGGIKGWSEQIQESDSKQAAQQLIMLSGVLKEEILFHSLLARAEQHELEVRLNVVGVEEIFNHLNEIFFNQVTEEKKTIEFLPFARKDRFKTDRSLLLRVLVNMVKNALEATPPGETVTVGFEWRGLAPTFRVHNLGYIDPRYQAHIFERSFSTKGDGRGIGTYSIKLFGEQYLKGSVSFNSNPEEGTTFVIQLPAQEYLLQREDSNKSEGRKMNYQSNKILLVDDDDSQSLLGRLLLERLGYQVQVCNTGERAIEIFKAAPQDFLFVMTDYIMMPMDGLDTARNILSIDPDACVLLCTGRDDSELVRTARQVGVRYTALKPANREEMFDLLESAGLTVITQGL
jgi:CheY-like chemotaxis protein